MGVGFKLCCQTKLLPSSALSVGGSVGTWRRSWPPTAWEDGELADYGTALCYGTAIPWRGELADERQGRTLQEWGLRRG